MKTGLVYLSFFALFLSVILPANSFAESLKGQVINKGGTAIPGMEVRLYHPSSGLSRPRYTNQKGVFYFDFVPPVSGKYDIEYYWKGKLIYRGSIKIVGDFEIPPIIL